MDKTLIKENAGTPNAKNVSAKDVYTTSTLSKEPYPKRQLTISLEAIRSPKAAGIESNKDNQIYYFVMY